MSRAALTRRFTDLVGEPPRAYLTGWRLDLAAYLLRESDATLGAVAPAARLRGRLRAQRRVQAGARDQAIAVNGLKPVIDRVLPFDDAVAAYRYYQSGQAFGKVVISQG